MNAKLAIVCFLAAFLSGCIDGGTETSSPAAKPDWITDIEIGHGHIEIRLHAYEENSRFCIEVISEIDCQAIPEGTLSVEIGFLGANSTVHYWIEQGNQQTTKGIAQTSDAQREWANLGEAIIQPGRQLFEGNQPSCTLAFLLKDSRNQKIYGLTAGHCGLGDTVMMNDPVTGFRRAVGTTVHQVAKVEHGYFHDWGLIEFNPHSHAIANPSIQGWGGPTAMGDPALMQGGERVCMTGHGAWVNLAAQSRCGTFQRYIVGSHGSAFLSTIPVNDGDSGSPIIDYDTGQALGILRGTHPNQMTSSVSLCQTLLFANEEGYRLGLITAPNGNMSNTPTTPYIDGDPLAEDYPGDGCKLDQIDWRINFQSE